MVSTIREVQLCSFTILKEVVRICEKHNLTYYLNFGTLLGAVRHKGFIPWDDDIDIEMPLKDYRKFLKIAPKEISKDFFIQTYKTEHNFNVMWTQVRANNTTSMPLKYKDLDIHWGIHIDIFPLVGISRGKIAQKIQAKGIGIAQILIYKEYMQVCEPEELAKCRNLKKLFILPRWLREFLCGLILKVVLKDPYKAEFCSALERQLSFRIKSSSYRNQTSVEFEGAFLAAPENYDDILTTIYGDYMTPPPESKRTGHVGELGSIINDVTTDYRVYKNQA